MSEQAPVVFLTFANSSAGANRQLTALNDERAAIEDALKVAEALEQCEILSRADTSGDDIFGTFQDPKFRDRIAVFHFSGHGSADAIHLAGKGGWSEQIYAGGFAQFLGAQESLKLVFLNACSSAGLVDELQAAGVPAVIATTEEVDDVVARKFATRFYQGVASGATILNAFAEAEAEFLSKISQTQADTPWKLYATASDSAWALTQPKAKVTRASSKKTLALLGTAVLLLLGLIGLSVLKAPTALRATIVSDQASFALAVADEPVDLLPGSSLMFEHLNIFNCGSQEFGVNQSAVGGDNWSTLKINCDSEGSLGVSDASSTGNISQLIVTPGSIVSIETYAASSPMLLMKFSADNELSLRIPTGMVKLDADQAEIRLVQESAVTFENGSSWEIDPLVILSPTDKQFDLEIELSERTLPFSQERIFRGVDFYRLDLIDGDPRHVSRLTRGEIEYPPYGGTDKLELSKNDPLTLRSDSKMKLSSLVLDESGQLEMMIEGTMTVADTYCGSEKCSLLKSYAEQWQQTLVFQVIASFITALMTLLGLYSLYRDYKA